MIEGLLSDYLVRLRRCLKVEESVSYVLVQIGNRKHYRFPKASMITQYLIRNADESNGVSTGTADLPGANTVDDLCHHDILIQPSLVIMK